MTTTLTVKFYNLPGRRAVYTYIYRWSLSVVYLVEFYLKSTYDCDNSSTTEVHRLTVGNVLVFTTEKKKRRLIFH